MPTEGQSCSKPAKDSSLSWKHSGGTDLLEPTLPPRGTATEFDGCVLGLGVPRCASLPAVFDH